MEANAELGQHGCLRAVGVRRGTEALQNGELEHRISSKIECKKEEVFNELGMVSNTPLSLFSTQIQH